MQQQSRSSRATGVCLVGGLVGPALPSVSASPVRSPSRFAARGADLSRHDALS